MIKNKEKIYPVFWTLWVIPRLQNTLVWYQAAGINTLNCLNFSQIRGCMFLLELWRVCLNISLIYLIVPCWFLQQSFNFKHHCTSPVRIMFLICRVTWEIYTAYIGISMLIYSLSIYGSLNENASSRFPYLNIWSPMGSTGCEC